MRVSDRPMARGRSKPCAAGPSVEVSPAPSKLNQTVAILFRNHEIIAQLDEIIAQLDQPVDVDACGVLSEPKLGFIRSTCRS